MSTSKEFQRSKRRSPSSRKYGDGRSSSDEYASSDDGDKLRDRRSPPPKRRQPGRSRGRRQRDRSTNDRSRRRGGSPKFEESHLSSMAPSDQSYMSSTYAEDMRSCGAREDDDELFIDVLYAGIRNRPCDAIQSTRSSADSAADSVIATVHAVPPARSTSWSSSNDSSKPLVTKQGDKKQKGGHFRHGHEGGRSEHSATSRHCPVALRPVIVGGSSPYDGTDSCVHDGPREPPPSSSYFASIYEEIEPKSRLGAGVTAILLTISSLAAIGACLTLTVLDLSPPLPQLSLAWQVNETAVKHASKVANAVISSSGNLLTFNRVAGYKLRCLDTTTCLCNLDLAWGHLSAGGESPSTVTEAGYYHVISKITFMEQQRRCGCAEVSLVFKTEKSIQTVSTSKMTIDRESASASGSNGAAFTVHQEFTRAIDEGTRILVNASCLQINVCQVAVDVLKSIVSVYYLGPLERNIPSVLTSR